MPVETIDLNFTYMPDTPFAVQALKNVSLRVEDGEFLGIIGHTGCGKSTLIQQLAGLIKPDAGSVLVDGKDINAQGYDRKTLRRTVGVVFQYPEYQLFEETVGKDVAFGPTKAGMSEEEVKRNVETALRLVGLTEELAEASPFELSGGQKRKVAIAGVLAMDPKVLILDEPIAGLDPLARESFMQLIKGLNESGVTIIMISHNMDGLCDYASRVIAMDGGEIVLDGTPAQVFGENIGKLREMGLDASEARKAGYMLAQRGFDIPDDIIGMEELADCVAKQLGGGRNA